MEDRGELEVGDFTYKASDIPRLIDRRFLMELCTMFDRERIYRLLPTECMKILSKHFIAVEKPDK